MAVKWTEEQQEVLNVRDKNVLVSAAAGSGKTAVLVERIIKIITNKENPVDIDKLLVVTFTNAAAGEMRERILAAIEKEFKSDPDNEHLERQISYIHNAQITTIDSFCLNIVRQNFDKINIDPSFRTADEGELSLLSQDAIEKVIESFYEKGNEDFLEFIDDYSSKRGDKKVEEIILSLYRFSMSYPYPKVWLDNCIENYNIDKNSIYKMNWFKDIENEVEDILKYNLENIKIALEIANGEEGPFHYSEALTSDIEYLKSLIDEKDFDTRMKMLDGFKAKPLSRKKVECSEALKDRIKNIRDSVKKSIKTLKEKIYPYPMEIVVKDMEKCKKHIEIIIELTKCYMDQFNKIKKERNVIDFADMEHMALDILVSRDEFGNITPTDTARDMSEEFYEIMIDEYQDSNLVQETILTAFKNNMFMVGDVKQSIYKFRLARPELFMEKYNKYPVDENGSERRIILSKNFRSRKEVLNGSNFIFSQIMTKEGGGIEYDKDNSLYYGSSYSDGNSDDNSIEILLVDKRSKENLDDDDVEDKELEAYMVADKIEDMIKNEFLVTDKKTGNLRKVEYSDFAILLRSISGFGEVYNQVFASRGIPLQSQVKSGYFESFEANSIINFLQIIDNPRQDIPLVATLKNIFGFTEKELALIVGNDKENRKTDFYEHLLNSTEKKVIDFLELLNIYRDKKNHCSIHDIIVSILEDTGFEYFISAMKGGKFRLANIEVLKERAILFEKGSYSGIFNFVRYIENLRKFQLKQEEAAITDGNAVTLISIHKSKGLEYPVVILGASGKKFNNMDGRDTIVINQDLGIGLDYYDRKSGIKAKTLVKHSISSHIIKENLSEELRILYVALTRAKEKLIIAGSFNCESFIKKNIALRDYDHTKFPPEIIYSSASYIDWIMKSLMRHRSFTEIYHMFGEGVPFSNHLFDHESRFEIQIVNPESIAYSEVKKEFIDHERKNVFYKWDTSYTFDIKERENIEENLSSSYKYEKYLDIKGKVSVSDLKHMFIEKGDENISTYNSEEIINGHIQDERKVPRFVREDIKENIGAKRGTAYHRIFELIKYEDDNIKDIELFKIHIDKIINSGKIEMDMAVLIDYKKIFSFIKSDLGQRFTKAYKNKKLFREQQFVMGISANMVNSNYPKDENVLVQGIIDAFFEEEEEIIIVDYKTDNVNNEKELVEKYKTQLDYYGMAIEKITGKKVKEKIIYSVKLDKWLTLE